MQQSFLSIKSEIGVIELVLGLVFLLLAMVRVMWPVVTFIGSLLLLLRIILALDKPATVRGSPWLHGSLLVFFLSGWAGYLVSYDRSLSLPLLTAFVGTFLLFYAALDMGRQIRSWITAFVITVTVIAVYYILAYEGFGYQPEIRIIHRLGELTGLWPGRAPFWLQRNAAATIFEGAILLGLGLWLMDKPRRMLWTLCLGLVGYGLFLTVSRGAWLAVFVTIVLWGVLYLPKRWRKLAGVGIIVAVLAMVFLIVTRVGESYLTSDSGRLDLYVQSSYLLKDFWLTGIGLGETFAMAYSRAVLLIEVPFLTYSHNLLLQIWLGQGLIGIISFLVLLGAFYGFVMKNRDRAFSQQQTLFDGAWLGVTAILVHGLVDATQFVQFLSLPPLFVLMAIVLSSPLIRTSAAQTQTRPIPVFALAGASLGLILLVFIVWRQPLISLLYSNQAALQLLSAELTPGLEREQRQRKLQEADRLITQALRINPDNSVAIRWLGIKALKTNQFDQAVTHLEQAIQLEPNNFTLHKGLGYAYLWQGNLEAAEPLLADVPEALVELNAWVGIWQGRGQDTLSERAAQMRQTLQP